MATKRNSMVFIVTDRDRELLEDFRAGRGLRSLAEGLRVLIRETEDAPERLPRVGADLRSLDALSARGLPKAAYGSRLKKR